MPVKTAFLKRAFVRVMPMRKLHPNPEDEFCDLKIGPNYEIISHYQHEIWVAKKQRRIRDLEEDLIVEKIRPDGYMLLNGHHRWAAAKRMGLRSVPVRIVNLTHAGDIKKMLKNAKHDKRVALDLDEVVFVSGEDTATEKALPFPANRVYKERVRYGIPALFRFSRPMGTIFGYTRRSTIPWSISSICSSGTACGSTTS